MNSRRAALHSHSPGGGRIPCFQSVPPPRPMLALDRRAHKIIQRQGAAHVIHLAGALLRFVTLAVYSRAAGRPGQRLAHLAVRADSQRRSLQGAISITGEFFAVSAPTAGPRFTLNAPYRRRATGGFQVPSGAPARPVCHTPPKHERGARGRSDGPASVGASALPGVPSLATREQDPPARPVLRVAEDPRGKTGIPAWKQASAAAREGGGAGGFQRDAPGEVPGASISLL